MDEQERILAYDVTAAGRCTWSPCREEGTVTVVLTTALREHLKTDKREAPLHSERRAGYGRIAGTPNGVRLCEPHFAEAKQLGLRPEA